MRWETKPGNTCRYWRRWFAWRPVKLNDGYSEPGRWVWLEVLNRRRDPDYYWEYQEIPK